MLPYKVIAQDNGQWTSFLAPHSFSDVGRKLDGAAFWLSDESTNGAIKMDEPKGTKKSVL